MNANPEILEVEDDMFVQVGVPAADVVAKAGQSMVARQEQANVPAAITPMEMLDRALASGRDLETIEKLMGLQERWEANQARKAFNEAFAAFKAEAVTVVRNRLVTDGPLKNKRYAELVAFVDAATPALSKHGLSASWNITRDEKDWIEVTCTIEHVLGGKKQVSLGGPPDAGGAKNALQARISTVTYLERATFKAACGLAEQGDDDDGRGGSGINVPINQEQVKTILRLCEETGTPVENFCQWAKIDAVPQLPSADFDKAIRVLEMRRRKSA